MFEGLKIQFLNPIWLALLPLVWALCWLFLKRFKTHSMWSELCDKHLLRILLPKASQTKTSSWLVWIMIIVFSLIILAAAGPSWRTQPIPLFESAASRAIVLDLSRSMMAEDIEPTRFKRAVFKAKDLISSNKDGQTALIAFAGAAFVVSPLTDDNRTLLNFLDSLKPDIMPVQGSRIDQAILMAEKVLQGSLSTTSHIYILSDGVSELEAAVTAAKNAANNGLSVSVLALGTEQGGPIKDSSGRLIRDQQGQLIIAKVGFGDLQKIAQAGNGRFVRMTASDSDIEYLLSAIDENEFDQSQDSEDKTLSLPVNDGIWLVWLILPLALLLFRKNALWLLALILILPPQQQAYAFDWNKLWKNKEQQAYEAFQKGQYDEVKSLSSDPQLKGSAFYKEQDYQNAETWFSQQGTAQSFYNRGNALAQMQQFEMALAAYDYALDKDPEHESAKYNKNLIEEFLRQQINQQNSQQNDENQGDESSDESADQSESDQSQSEQSRAPRSSSDDDLQSDSTEEQQEEQKQIDPEDEEGNPADKDLALQNETNRERKNPESIDRWINRLPDDPSELLRRKFLRDYQRQSGLGRQ